ncbi:hypothetical protein Ae201684P_017941 [Aphanomyces euteiches]|nr:hypothetical protein Ae201684P_017941 [Aphanomyces euteiches]
MNTQVGFITAICNCPLLEKISVNSSGDTKSSSTYEPKAKKARLAGAINDPRHFDQDADKINPSWMPTLLVEKVYGMPCDFST